MLNKSSAEGAALSQRHVQDQIRFLNRPTENMEA